MLARGFTSGFTERLTTFMVSIAFLKLGEAARGLPLGEVGRDRTFTIGPRRAWCSGLAGAVRAISASTNSFLCVSLIGLLAR